MNELNKDFTKSAEDDANYIDNLAKEADNLFDIDNTSEDTVSESEEVYTGNKTKRRIRLNKGLLALGGAMLLVSFIFGRHFKDIPDRVAGEAVQNSNSISDYDTKAVNGLYTRDTAVREDISVDIIDESEESTAIKPMEGEHLTGIPVIVTEEVDAYFKDSIKYLKLALSVDTFIAENNIYGNEDLINALQRLVTNFEESVSSWSSHSIPEGCEEYDELIVKSLDDYQYYFEEVIASASLETREEYRNKLDAAISYIQSSVSGYGSIYQSYTPVFYYYGLYD